MSAILIFLHQIGKLGAIAVIRTALNYFLMREMQQELDDSETKKGIEEDSRTGVETGEE